MHRARGGLRIAIRTAQRRRSHPRRTHSPARPGANAYIRGGSTAGGSSARTSTRASPLSAIPSFTAAT